MAHATAQKAPMLSRRSTVRTTKSDSDVNETENSQSFPPRLLNMRQVAAYLGCSFWTARDYILQGLIPAVDMPPLRTRAGDRRRTAFRRVLVDRADLGRFIESRKRRPPTGVL
jgi:hypothetical protein